MADENDRRERERGSVEAVALRYRHGEDDAPRVVATGRGHLAEKILDLAREWDVPVHEDPDLMEVLSKLDINEEIPPHVYRAVAEILAFVYTLNDRWRDRSP